MKRNSRVLLVILLLIALLSAGGYDLVWRIHQDVMMVSVFTDRQAYRVGEKVRISIRNQGVRPIDIYCPVFCALGNFPTRVERSVDGVWEYFAGFCPSVEPLFGNWDYSGDYIRHRLPAEDAFELELSNFETLRLRQAETLRIMYYVGVFKRPIYSNEFTLRP